MTSQMLEESGASAATRPMLSIWVLRAIVGYLLILKLVFSLTVPPNADESYYWLWGQHLQWSYLDHGPLTGWAEWLGYRLFGWNLLGMRFPALASFAGVMALAWLWAKRLAPANTEYYFWAVVAIYAASPLMGAVSTLIYPDHLLLMLTALALWFLVPFLTAQAEGRPGLLRDLYFGAFAMGLAALAKYNAVFIALGFAVVIVLTPRLRSLLRSPHLYLAAALTLAVASPIIFWNVANGLPTLKLHAVQRFAGGAETFSLNGMWRFLWMSALYLSPFLLPALLKFLWPAPATGHLRSLRAIGGAMFALSTLAVLGLAGWSAAAGQVAPHWNDVALVPLLLAAPLVLRSRVLTALHFLFGGAFVTIATLYYVSAPLLTNAIGISDGEATITYGQDQLADAMRSAKARYGADFYATGHYTSAAKLAFGLGSDAAVTSLNTNVDQFDFWVDAATLTGKSAILMGGNNQFQPYFDSVEPIGEVTTTRYGHALATYHLFLGRGFHLPDGALPK